MSHYFKIALLIWILAMQKHIQQYLIFLAMLLFSAFAFAQTALQEQSVFDIEKANAQFNIISSIIQILLS